MRRRRSDWVHPVTPHYSLLLKIDAAHYPNVTGDLAESWTVSPDGTVYTFKPQSRRPNFMTARR
jgi:ABC-type transport system substrate-binding protein